MNRLFLLICFVLLTAVGCEPPGPSEIAPAPGGDKSVMLSNAKLSIGGGSLKFTYKFTSGQPAAEKYFLVLTQGGSTEEYDVSRYISHTYDSPGFKFQRGNYLRRDGEKIQCHLDVAKINGQDRRRISNIIVVN